MLQTITKIVALCALTLTSFVGCSKTEKTNTTVTFATEGAYKPFNYVDNQGQLAGFDVDIANSLCAKMQVTCKIVAQDWDGIIPGLMASKYDAIIAGMSVTEERSKVVDFSEPYFLNSLVYIGKKGNTIDTTKLNGVTIGSQRSTIAASYLEDNLASTNTIKLYDSQENAYLDLSAGRVDMMLSDKVPAIDWLNTPEGAEYETKGDEIAIDDKLAIAIRKNDPLKQKVDAALAAIKADGTYQRISDKYFK